MCLFTNQWIVWDRSRKETIGWFATKREAEYCAAQLELF
jgi:hypothetical protein